MKCGTRKQIVLLPLPSDGLFWNTVFPGKLRREKKSMTPQAGEVKSGLLWKQEYLSPLPIPTGQPAADVLGMIWRKNDIYLDIGSLSLSGGWVTLYSMSMIFAGGILLALFQGIFLAAIL